MAAIEGVHITVATGKNLTIIRIIYKCGCFKEKKFMTSVNFGPFIQFLLARRLIFMLTEKEQFFKLEVICKKVLTELLLLLSFRIQKGCLCNRLISNFLSHLSFNWSTFLRRFAAHW